MATEPLRAGLSALRDRSRDTIYAFAGGVGVGLGLKHPADPGLLDTAFDNGIGPAVSTMIDVRRILFWVAIGLLVLVFAAITNPAESSFRSHLTSISFRRHLSDIEVDQDREPAPFRFANHVAISLRTPTLFYRSVFFFSLALTVAPAPPIYLSDPVLSSRAKHPRPTHVVYIGFVGHWSALGEIPRWAEWMWGMVNKTKGKASLPGVLELQDASARHPELETLPLHTPAALAVESRRGSIVNLMTTVPPSPPPLEDDVPPSPALIALKTELVAAQAVLADLEAQLTNHDEAVSAAHAVLQAQLDEVRQRKKEDDAERQELKSKTKALEEQKRQAEAARREADKKLKSLESVRDGLQSKISTARGEIEDLRGNIELSEKNANIVQEEGEQYLEDTREAIEEKLREIDEMEHSVSNIEAHNEDLGRKVREAEQRLAMAVAGSRLAPEEEMMLMAAAYEAAASANEEYRQHDSTNNQWASQAAAYMAEGLPSLDQNYTARPVPAYRHNSSHRNLTTLGSGGSGADAGVGNVSRQVSHSVLAGFEDFGPGAAALGAGVGSRSSPVPTNIGAGINSRSLAAPRTTTPPPQQMDDADDPGSPNGAMSASFTANLLPQGLFRSLEGDAASTIDDDEDDEEDDEHDMVDTHGEFSLDVPPSIGFVSSSLINHGNHGSNNGLTHGHGGQAYGQPTTQGIPSPAHSASDSGDDRDRERERSSTRLVRYTPPHQIPLGQLPLPASNRWASTSASATDPAFPLFHPTTSNDSLVSPFAPSDSEKRALKWGPLSKYRWGGAAGAGGAAAAGTPGGANANANAAANGAHAGVRTGASDGGLGELAASLKREYPPHTYHQGYGHGYGLTAEELFNRAGSLAPPGTTTSARSSSIDLTHAPGHGRADSGGLGSWLSPSPPAGASGGRHFGEGAGIGSASLGHNGGGAGFGLGNGYHAVGEESNPESEERTDGRVSLGLGRLSGLSGLAGHGSVDDSAVHDADGAHEKKQFRFFSLRKPSNAGAGAA